VKKVRLLSAGAIAGMAGVMLMPLSASAADAAPSGIAQASALQVSISPSALLSAVPAVGSLLSSTLNGVLGGNTDLTIKVDAANANGLLSGNLLDLLSGHGDSTPLDIQFAPLQQELDTIQGLLKNGLSALNGVTGILNGTSGLTGALGNGGLLSGLTGLLGNNSGLLGTSGLGGLVNSLPIVNGLLGGLLGGNSGLGTNPGSLTSALNGLGVNLGNTLVANYNVPGVADTPTASSQVVATPAGAPIQLDLAPYHADAVTNSLAQAAGLTGARASADNSTTSLAVTPSLALPNLGGLLGTGGLGNLLGPNGILSNLLGPSGLPIVGSLLNGIVGGQGTSGGGLLGGLPLTGALSGLLGGSSGGLLSGLLGGSHATGNTSSGGLLGGVIGSGGLLSGLTGTISSLPVVGGVLAPIAGPSASNPGAALGLLGNNGGLLSALTGNGGLLGNLTNLNGVLGGLLGPSGLLGGLLNGQNLGLNSLVKTASVTSNAIVQPMTGGSFQSLATTKVGSLSVLPLGDQLLGDLGKILGTGANGLPLVGGLSGTLNGIVGGLNLGSLTNIGPLAGLLGGVTGGGTGGLAGLSLLNISGITSSAQAVLGPNSGDPTGTASLGTISVLGIPVINVDQVLGLVAGQSKTISIPLTGISLVLSRGVPQIGFNTATHKSVSVAALDVRLVNDGSGLLGSLLSNGSTSKPITEVALANTSADVSMAPPANATTPQISTPIQGPTPPSTGMFGPASFAAAGILAALAIALQAFPRLAARRRSVR
jgi:hypothetical protein